MRFLNGISSKYVKVNPYSYVQQDSGFRIRNYPYWAWLIRIGEYTVLCRYVSQKGSKSCTTGYLSFVGQDANKIISKNTLKARLYKVFRAFVKSAFCHATSNKKNVFCRSTSNKIGTILEIQEQLILFYSSLTKICMYAKTYSRHGDILRFNFVSLSITKPS